MESIAYLVLCHSVDEQLDILLDALVRRRKIWDFGWCEITEVLAHLVMLFRRHAADEASAVSGWCRV